MPTFSAALLAGGHSRRMGRDKAMLPHPSGGVFWEHQLAVLEELQPEEIFWSGPLRDNLPAGVRVIEDAAPDAGPLGGLVACLAASRSDLLVVLAVDLANIRADFLRRLLAVSTELRGAVGRHDPFYEPLAAVYPSAMRALAETHLAHGRLALQDLVGEAKRTGLVRVIEIGADEAALLRNFNEAADLR
jgi:molybdopterin-guanine dinucleotide biosynthesis protein A